MIFQESSGTSKESLTPEEVCPFPKARPIKRKEQGKTWHFDRHTRKEQN
jgi:hypothetical protein